MALYANSLTVLFEGWEEHAWIGTCPIYFANRRTAFALVCLQSKNLEDTSESDSVAFKNCRCAAA